MEIFFSPTVIHISSPIRGDDTYNKAPTLHITAELFFGAIFSLAGSA